MSDLEGIISSGSFDEFTEKIKENEEFYKDRGDFEEEVEDLKEALKKAPIPFMFDSSCQTVEEWFAKYRGWIKNVRREALKEMSHVFVVLKYHKFDTQRPAILGVYERLSDAVDDHIPEDAESVEATDEIAIYETREEKFVIENRPVTERGESMF